MTTTTTIGLLLFSAACFCVVQIIIGNKERKQKKHFSAIYKSEITKSYFAAARNEMMKMVVENRINSNTEFFKKTYHLNTVIMRNPDKYSQISSELMGYILKPNTNNKEQKLELNVDERKICLLTANALGHIIIDYSFALKILFKFEKIFRKEQLTKISFVSHIIQFNHDQEKIKAQKAIENVKHTLRSISSGHTDFKEFAMCSI